MERYSISTQTRDSLLISNEQSGKSPTPLGVISPTLYAINKQTGAKIILPKRLHCLLPKAHVFGPLNDIDCINDVFYFTRKQTKTWCSLFDVVDLREILKSGCLDDEVLSENVNIKELREILSRIDNTDNPVLRIFNLSTSIGEFTAGNETI